MTTPSRPFLVEFDAPPPNPAEAPPVPDEGTPLAQTAVAAALGARAKASPARKVFFWAAGLFMSIVVSMAAFDFINGLMARYPMLAYLALGAAVVAVAALVWIAGREWAALMRLGRIDHLKDKALAVTERAQALAVVEEVSALYAARPEMAWARTRLAEQTEGMFDADAVLQLAETELLSAPDQAARRAIEAASRRVAATTAIVPLALVDVAVALATNLQMIRKVAEIYGGRSGTLGSLSLLRRVFSHLIATGAVAVGDDLISSVAGGGVMSKLSRRFGEGVINGALTARVGIAAMEVCRPLPFNALRKPKVTSLLGRALTGLFDGVLAQKPAAPVQSDEPSSRP